MRYAAGGCYVRAPDLRAGFGDFGRTVTMLSHVLGVNRAVKRVLWGWNG